MDPHLRSAGAYIKYRGCLFVSMPEFPKPIPDLTQEQALTMILSSIALEEVALSHIINAEGEKIQYVLTAASTNGCLADLKDIAAVKSNRMNYGKQGRPARTRAFGLLCLMWRCPIPRLDRPALRVGCAAGNRPLIL